MTNREVGLIWMADVLTRLHDAWPERLTLYMKQTITDTGVKPSSRYDKLWCDLWLWLVDEGLVRIKSNDQDQPARSRRDLLGQRVEMAVLTAKGFDALRNMTKQRQAEATPDSTA